MREAKRRVPNLKRYLTECGLLYRGFHAFLPSVRQAAEEFSWTTLFPQQVTVKICQKTKYTERLQLSFGQDQQTKPWDNWVLELQLYHDVFAAEVTMVYQVVSKNGHLSLQALAFDDKIHFHHLLLEWLVIKVITPAP